MVMSPAQFYAKVGDRFHAREGRDNPHRGLDFPWGNGIEIPAYRDGVAVLNVKNADLGFVLVVRWNRPGLPPYFASFCHLREASPLQHGHWFSKGDVLGIVGNTGRQSFGSHLHTTLGLTLTSYCRGDTFDPLPYINECIAEAGNQPEAPPPLEGDDMIRIVNTYRGIALIGAGYYRHIGTSEELSASSSVMSKHIVGNEREWDLWVSLALGGVSAKPTA
ncbi:MAG: hypothetical protein B5766_08240 [Candidatus Lumbricidophila eiseniae]|uniref:M23ase beta-sheet core domain-containing protein n=1 Tax=Candidatus Lumbricidiphila eiseniae TaxID=1969409 RepID=A0A2A6FQF9_9MICO|nr:MAG: hypothetical protein B5766_08240 [Candidatus Lumbricidophila eiseniae]